VRRDFGRLTEAAGLGHWSPNELRHTAVSLLSAKGVPLEHIADVMGHEGTRMTSLVYRHLMTPSIGAAVKPMGDLFSWFSSDTTTRSVDQAGPFRKENQGAEIIIMASSSAGDSPDQSARPHYRLGVFGDETGVDFFLAPWKGFSNGFGNHSRGLREVGVHVDGDDDRSSVSKRLFKDLHLTFVVEVFDVADVASPLGACVGGRCLSLDFEGGDEVVRPRDGKVDVPIDPGPQAAGKPIGRDGNEVNAPGVFAVRRHPSGWVASDSMESGR
ncbi:MAG TPA: hypothetical protein EYQ31_13075, partial [Candidatus Handelsmanbacteria bacterium]|nr:hypothetical protein [Candidatus Handelsmanbacteria bacterium]